MKYNYLVSGANCLVLSAVLGLPAAAQTTRLDPAFQLPQIILATSTGPAAGTVADVVQQPDGKYVIGGYFTSINGVRAHNLARLNADGTLDAAFTANCRASGPVFSLALQPDGSILAGGQFDSLASVPRLYLGRLLPSGVLDATFTPAVPFYDYRVNQVAVLPGGDVLSLTSSSPRYGVTPTGLRRFSALTGQPVPGFAPAIDALCMAVQPDGKILTGGGGSSYIISYMLARLLPTGSLDPGFVHRTNAFIAHVSQVGQGPSGDAYMAGDWNGAQLQRAEFIGPQGSLGVGGLAQVNGFAFQPNGRIMLNGLAVGAGQPVTSRILPNGQIDASYTATNGPRNATVRRMLVQPNGAIMMAGNFTMAGTTPAWGLVRMLDSGVLASKNAEVEKATTAWPVPATKTLNVGFAVGARPRQVQLLDAMGRVVLARAAPATSSFLTLDVAELPLGAYALRVDYEQVGPVTRRIVLGE
jgi:uncharacterized delta-60 repeat protein